MTIDITEYQWHKHEDGVWHKRNKEAAEPRLFRDKAVKALDREYYEATDQVILEALGIESKSMLKSEAGGKGRPGGRCL